MNPSPSPGREMTWIKNVVSAGGMLLFLLFWLLRLFYTFLGSLNFRLYVKTSHLRISFEKGFVFLYHKIFGISAHAPYEIYRFIATIHHKFSHKSSAKRENWVTFSTSSMGVFSETPKIILASDIDIVLLVLFAIFCTVSWATPDFEASSHIQTIRVEEREKHIRQMEFNSKPQSETKKGKWP